MLKESSWSPDEGDDRQDKENNKKDFRDPCSGASNSTKTEKGSDQRDDQENNGVVEHI
jgi:hypothetical protein